MAFVSLPAVLAHNRWADWRLFDIGLLTVYDYPPYDVPLPLGGLLIAVFVGFRVAAAGPSLAAPAPLAAPAVLVVFVFGHFG